MTPVQTLRIRSVNWFLRSLWILPAAACGFLVNGIWQAVLVGVLFATSVVLYHGTRDVPK